MPNDRRCKLCEELLPQLALHFSNQIAIECGYCCWMCMTAALGEEKAHRMLADKSGQKMHESPQETRSEHE